MNLKPSTRLINYLGRISTMAENLDAKKRFNERRRGTKTGSATLQAQAFNTGKTSITLPSVSEATFKQEIALNPQINSGVSYSEQGVNVVVPGLPNITPDTVSQSLPQLQVADFQISDPLNPGIQNKCSTEQFNKLEQEYEQGKNYLKAVGLAADYVGEGWNAVGKIATATNKGLVAAKNVETAKGSMFDYLKQTEITEQKGIAYVTATHQTSTERVGQVYTIAQNETKVHTLKTKAEKSFYELQSAKSETDAFLEKLKGAQSK